MKFIIFKLGKFEIYLSSTITIRNTGFDFEILPRLTYWKDMMPIDNDPHNYAMTRAVIMAWLIFYVSVFNIKQKKKV